MSTETPSEEPVSEEGRASVTVDEALELAMQIHRSGIRTRTDVALAEAEQVYVRILEVVPQHPDALHYLGVLMHQTGRSEQGIELIRRALGDPPTNADACNNFGNALRESDRRDEAAVAYRQALAIDPGHVAAHNNLGMMLRNEGRFDEAVTELQRAIELAPEVAGTHSNLGNVYRRMGRDLDAIKEFRAAVALDGRHPDARKYLGMALYHNGQVAEGLRVFENWLKYEPDNPFAKHMLASCSGRDVPPRCSDTYVQQSFDLLSGHFDEHLRGLGYCGPELTYAAYAAVASPPSGSLVILDAGCGTGLCAPLFRPHAKHLVGVDLSAGMLTLAHRRKLYDDLQQKELTVFLKGTPDAYDVIISADTLEYFGDLDEVIALAAGALHVGGQFVFTLEKAEGIENAQGWKLNTHGRYSHEEAYVRRVLVRAGFDVLSLATETLRMESMQPVPALVIVAQRGAVGG